MSLLFAIIAGSIFTDFNDSREVEANYPNPCQIEGQEFHSFFGTTRSVKLRSSGETIEIYDAQVAAIAPTQNGPEAWVVMSYCPVATGSEYRVLFETEQAAQAAFPELWRKKLALQDRRASQAAISGAGKGDYEAAMIGTRAAIKELHEHLEGMLFTFHAIDAHHGGCLCGVKKG